MQFHYVAYSIEQGVVKGKVEAQDVRQARDEVRRQGLKVLRLRPVRRLPSAEELFPSLFRVGTGDLVHFARQLATMLNSGGSLLRTLEMLEAETRNRVMRRVLAGIRKTLDAGGSLSAALAEHPKVFSRLFISVVEVGEYTGRLGPAMDQLADILEREHEAKQKAMRTLMYPMAIIGLSLVTLGVLMTVALPPLLRVFDDLGADVPATTRVALGLFVGIKANFVKLLLGAALTAAAVGALRRIERVRYVMDGAMARVPLLGPLLIGAELARFSRTMAMLLEAGVSLATALRLGIGGCRNMVLRQAFVDAEEALVGGHGLTESLRRCPILPRLFVELVAIGEESNTLRRTMSDMASAYQKQVDDRLAGLLGMLEPVSTAVVGAIVGFIAFSMFVPIYSGLNAID